MGAGELNAGGNPAMDYHPIQSLHAAETGISSGLVGHIGPYADFTYLPLPFHQIV